MATISEDKDVFTVMVRFILEQGAQEEFQELVMEMAPFFESQPGFISQTIHKSLDGSRIVNYLQWRSEEDHKACMNNPQMATRGEKLQEMIEKGMVAMHVRSYEVIYSKEA